MGAVLVIDDEKRVRDVIQRALELKEIDVHLEEDGEGGVSAVQAEPQRFDLVLLDLSMPGLSGKETLERLRATRADLRVVLMSGGSESGLPEGVGFLQKPFRLKRLYAVIEEALGH